MANVEMAFGSYYFSTPAVTTIAAQDTPIKASGTTTALQVNNFTHSGSNRLTYTGTTTLYFQITGLFSATKAAGTGADIRFIIAKNGSVVTGMSVTRNVSSSVEGAMACGGILQLETDDYIELWVENQDNADNMTVQEGSVSAITVG